MVHRNGVSPQGRRKASPKGGKNWLTWKRTLAIMAVIAAVATAWNWPLISGNARLATAYGAHIGCSCRYIGGRSLDDCEKDFEPGMETVSLSDDTEAKEVTASVPIIASATARYDPASGCRIITD